MSNHNHNHEHEHTRGPRSPRGLIHYTTLTLIVSTYIFLTASAAIGAYNLIT